MGTLTVTEIKTEVRAALGGRTDFDTRLDAAINIAQTRLARLHDFEELRSLDSIATAVTVSAAADKIISLSTLGNYRKIYSIRLYATNTLSRKLKKIMPRRWDQLVPEPEYYARGTPSHYVMWGKTQLELWRVPDVAYTLHFRLSTWPTAVTAGAQSAVLDFNEADDLIILLTSSYLALLANNTQRSNELYKVFAQSALDRLKEEVEDFDTHIAAHGTEIRGALSLGYNDPFVRSVELP